PASERRRMRPRVRILDCRRLTRRVTNPFGPYASRTESSGPRIPAFVARGHVCRGSSHLGRVRYNIPVWRLPAHCELLTRSLSFGYNLRVNGCRAHFDPMIFTCANSCPNRTESEPSAPTTAPTHARWW